MDSCIPHDVPAAPEISSLSESSTDPPDSAGYSSGDFCMNGLKSCLNEIMTMKDIERTTCDFTPSPEENGMGNVVKEVECNEYHGNKSSTVASEKHFSKCATSSPGEHNKFPAEELVDGKEKQGNDVSAGVSTLNGYPESADQSYSHTISLPLVSAMKGSREKHGIPPKKLSVTWAPEVYDPVPSSVSHAVTNKNQCHRSDNRKHGKNKQKGNAKSSRGGKGKGKGKGKDKDKDKEKKQARKHVGSASRSFKSLDHHDMMAGFNESRSSIVDFDVGSPESFCGSSFLKKSVVKLHFPTAEAT